MRAAVAAATAGITLPAVRAASSGRRQRTRNQMVESPLSLLRNRLCGVMVGVKEGQVVATHGDMQAEVNRGLNCIKGYFLSKIMYGADRLTTPLLRKRAGVYSKDGEFEASEFGGSLRRHGRAVQKGAEGKGPDSCRNVRLRAMDNFRRLCCDKLMRAGFRSNDLDPNARHCMASAAYAFMRTFGMDEPMGCYDDFEHADAFVLWGSNMAEMHPILWTRIADRRLGHEHVKVAVLSTFTHRSMDLADVPIVFKPGTDLAILNYIANHIIQTGRVNEEFVKQHTTFMRGATDIGYGLRPDDPLEVKAANSSNPAKTEPMNFEEFKNFVSEYTLKKVADLSGVDTGFLEELRRALCRPQSQGDVSLDHGLQSARARSLGQPDGVQYPSADWQNIGARQQPVLIDGPAFGLRHGA